MVNTGYSIMLSVGSLPPCRPTNRSWTIKERQKKMLVQFLFTIRATYTYIVLILPRIERRKMLWLTKTTINTSGPGYFSK